MVRGSVVNRLIACRRTAMVEFCWDMNRAVGVHVEKGERIMADLRMGLPGRAPIMRGAEGGERTQLRPHHISLYFGCAIAVFFFGIYTDISRDTLLGPLPMVSAIPGLLLLLPLYARRYFSTSFLGALALVAVSVTLGLLAPYDPDLLVRRLLASAQLLYSLIIGFMAFWVIGSFNRGQLSRFIGIFVLGYLMLLVLEVLTPLKSLTWEYIDVYHTGGLEASISEAIMDRDVGLGGTHRPKLFTSETSYIGMAITFLIGIYTWLGAGPTKYVKATFYAIVALIVVRSPIILGVFFIISVGYIGDLMHSRAMRRSAAWLLPVIVIIGCAAGAILYSVLEPLIASRLSGMSSGADYSTTYRTYGAVAAGLAVANKYPFFGVGIGAIDLAEPIIKDVFLSFGVPARAVDQEWRIAMGNALGFGLVVLGYVGLLVVTYTSWIGLTSLTGRLSAMFIALVAVLCFANAAIYSPKFVTYIMIFAAINRVMNVDYARYRAIARMPASASLT
jgi:hypothetical protein